MKRTLLVPCTPRMRNGTVSGSAREPRVSASHASCTARAFTKHRCRVGASLAAAEQESTWAVQGVCSNECVPDQVKVRVAGATSPKTRPPGGAAAACPPGVPLPAAACALAGSGGRSPGRLVRGMGSAPAPLLLGQSPQSQPRQSIRSHGCASDMNSYERPSPSAPSGRALSTAGCPCSRANKSLAPAWYAPITCAGTSPRHSVCILSRDHALRVSKRVGAAAARSPARILQDFVARFECPGSFGDKFSRRSTECSMPA
mmetsp:Transcript_18399/g.42861  ORF Transcript_18399/g.42861 Transcript_18399/m.42861 type:complete len:259 (+) Transcript_18399:200-976(+)